MLDMNGDNIQKTVTDLLDEWTSIAYLYGVVKRFAESYNGKDLPPGQDLQRVCR